jgi:two-component system, LuxR family, sensor kinase FixL
MRRDAKRKIVRSVRLRKAYSKFRRRHNAWLSIIKTRVITVGLLAVGAWAWGRLGLTTCLIIGIYLLINLSLIVISEATLRSRKGRLVPDCLDVFFVSSLIWVNGQINSSLSLFYLFPIISAARYKRRKGSLQVAGLAIATFVAVFFILGEAGDTVPYLILHCLSFLGMALVAGNLTKDRQLSEIKLLDVLREINDQIKSSPEDINAIYKLVLKKAMDITDSQKGHIRRVINEEQPKIVAHRGLREGYEEQDHAFTGSYSNDVIKKKASLVISTFSKKGAKQKLAGYFEESSPLPLSALFVPLTVSRGLAREVIAVIAVYDSRSRHYSRVDAVRIESFAPLLDSAEKQADLYRLSREDAKEKQRRLEMLHKLAGLFDAQQFEKDNLREIALQEIATLVMERLNSEEAAIFLWDKNVRKLSDKNVRNRDRKVRKVAEASPDTKITEELRKVESAYDIGESLTGQCFDEAKPNFSNKVDPAILYAEEYSKVLPSGRVAHIMVIPLIAGNNKIGVLRIINKRSEEYDVNPSNLASAGFSTDDRDLAQSIAIYIAAALNSNDRRYQTEGILRSLERTLEDSPNPTIVLDQDGRIIVFNRLCRKVWGMTTEQAAKKGVTELYESEAEAIRLGRMLWKSETKSFVDKNATIRNASGDPVPIRLSASLIFDEDGTFLGSVGVFKDLTEIKRVEERARLDTISKVLGFITHDVKNKLIAAKYDVATLDKQITRGDKQSADATLTGLDDTLDVAVNKLKNITLLQSFDIAHPNRELVFVERIFEEALEHWTRLANLSSTGLTLKEFPREKYKVLVDVEQIQMVLTNLYDNSADAIKKSNGQGRREIAIAVQTMGDDLQIIWSDTGCGIPDDNVETIFDVRSTTKEFGTGLGLYWAKTIIEQHEGVIKVASTTGEGTSFTISLPLRS